MRHPLLISKKVFFPFLGIWFFVFCIQFLTLYFNTTQCLAYCIADTLISGILYLVITLGLWYAIRFGIQSSRKAIDLLTRNIILFVLTSGLWILISMGVLYIIQPQWGDFYSETILSYRLVSSLMFYICSVVVYYAISFYETIQEKQKQEMTLKTLVKEAQLNELRAQLHPHFLFNSLNSINSLTISNPRSAGDMIIKLSEFLRYSLSRKGHSMADFEKELYHIKLYLDIEKVRFGKRLEFICNAPDVPSNWPIPLMLLQPLIENAVKHGVYNTEETVTIQFDAYILNDNLLVSIKNNFDKDSVPTKGTGTGLSNVRERMRLVYGRADLMETVIEKERFTVILTLPNTQPDSTNEDI
jgi:two-component system, LytTR family, sensor kinase